MNELRIFAELDIFPSVELALIRKEMKSFLEFQNFQQQEIQVNSNATSDQKSSQSNTKLSLAQKQILFYENLSIIIQVEKKMCEKKLHVLQNRRQEEQDTRTAMARKLARIKTLEDSQSKDPANFRNQKNL